MENKIKKQLSESFPGFCHKKLLTEIKDSKYFSEEIQNLLINSNIKFIYELVSKSKKDLVKHKLIKRKLIEEIEISLEKEDLNLAYILDEFSYTGKFPIKALEEIDDPYQAYSYLLRNLELKEGKHQLVYKPKENLKIYCQQFSINIDNKIKEIFSYITKENDLVLIHDDINKLIFFNGIERYMTYEDKKNYKEYNTSKKYYIKDVSLKFKKNKVFISYYMEIDS